MKLHEMATHLRQIHCNVNVDKCDVILHTV